MNLSPKQLKVQEAMLLRIHPGKSLEEARSTENIRGALTEGGFFLVDKDIVFVKGGYNGEDYDDCTVENISYLSYPEIDDNGNYIRNEKGENVSIDENIIGLPPTLPRVLQALGSYYFFAKGGIRRQMGEEYSEHICDRKLLNDDGSDISLRDQSVETQDRIAESLGVE